MKLIKIYSFVSCICILTLVALYSFYIKGYNRFYSFEVQRMNEILYGKTNYDILFLGSSRTYYQINPKIIDSITGLNSFNAGSDAANLLEMNLFLQCYLKSHRPPKLVVADIAKGGFEVSYRPIWNPNFYYPFLENKTVFDALEKYNNVFLLKHVPFTQFVMANDAMKQNAFLGHLGYTNVQKSKTYKGFVEKNADTISLPFKRAFPVIYNEVEQKGIDLLEQMILDCKKNNIEVIITYAPVYKLKDENSALFFPTIENICAKHQIKFLNYRKHYIGNQHSLFREEHHLNKNGVDIFSAMIGNDINSLLIKK